MSKGKLAGIILGCTVVIVVTIVLVIPQVTMSPEAALAQRVTQWVDLLSSVHMLSEEQALQEIESFLEPSAARPAKAREFYTAWADKGDWEEISSSVDEVSVDSTGLRATVRLTRLLEWLGEDIVLVGPGDRVIQTQVLKWRLIDKIWYRTMEPAEITMGDIIPADPESEPDPSPDPEPDPTPTPPEEQEPQTSRTNPAGLYQPIRVQVDTWIDGKVVLELEMLELISGHTAWSIVKGWNMFNDEPESGKEYILAKFRVKIVELEEEPWNINHAQFDVYSATGVMYTDWVSVAGKNPDLRTNLYEGAEHIGYTAFLVRTDDSPVAVYMARWDDNAIWFDLRS